MPERLSRRQFLIGTAASLLWVAAPQVSRPWAGLNWQPIEDLKLRPPEDGNLDPIFKVELRPGLLDSLTFEEASALTQRFNAIGDSLVSFNLEVDQPGLEQLVQISAPYFVSEGFVTEARYPNVVSFRDFNSEGYSNRIGFTDCANFIDVQGRTDTTTRQRFSPIMYFNTIHELSHVQQGLTLCTYQPDVELEVSAHIMSAEVVAAQAMDGNNFALRALADAMSDWSLTSAAMAAYQEDRLEEYLALKEDMLGYTNSSVEALRLQIEREQHDYTLYELLPLITVVNALRMDNGSVNLAIPSRPILVDGQSQDIVPSVVLDDLAICLTNFESLASEALDAA